MFDAKIEDLTLVQLRGIRREIGAMLENQAMFSKQVLRLYEQVGRLADELHVTNKKVNSLDEKVGAITVKVDVLTVKVDNIESEFRKEFQIVKSDIILLEMQNMSRHGETINALRRVEALERGPTDVDE
jgi:hypothetical protein